jgi:hypothetical protein
LAFALNPLLALYHTQYPAMGPQGPIWLFCTWMNMCPAFACLLSLRLLIMTHLINKVRFMVVAHLCYLLKEGKTEEEIN